MPGYQLIIYTLQFEVGSSLKLTHTDTSDTAKENKEINMKTKSTVLEYSIDKIFNSSRGS